MAYLFAPAAPAGNAGPNAYDLFNSDRLNAINTAPANGTVVIDLRNAGWTTVTRELFEAAANRGDVNIVIYYRHWGNDFMLTIPAGTFFSATLLEAQYLEASQIGDFIGLSPVPYSV